MKLLIIIIALTTSCWSSPHLQTNKPTSAPPRKELQLNVPKDIWEPLFFKTIDERARLGNLKTLRSDALTNDDLEIRVWHGFGLTALEGFVLRRTAGQWSATHLDGVTRKVSAAESQRSLGTPKSGWDGALKRLEEAGLFTLPDASAIGCIAGINDGMSYVVEFNRDGVYRTYMYENPDQAPCAEAKRMIEIGNIIAAEFGVPEMATE